MLQVSQTAMNDPRRATGGPGGEIMLLDNQGAASPQRTLPRDSDTVDAAANHGDVILFRRRYSSCSQILHACYLDAELGIVKSSFDQDGPRAKVTFV